MTDEDLRRLLESRHDLTASKKPEVMTVDSSLKAAVTTFRKDLEAARHQLTAAVAAVSREKTETEAERIQVHKCLASAVARYGFIRGKVGDALLNTDPDEQIDPKEIERRQKLYDRVFGIMPSDLDRLSQKAGIEKLESVTQSLSGEPDLKPLGYAGALSKTLTAAVSAIGKLNREIDEDSAAMVALRAAREQFDRNHASYALLVQAVLVREKRESEIGRYVLARDPTYAARRAARAPMEQEPGADEIEAEAGGDQTAG